MAREGWVTSQVEKLLDYCDQSASTSTQVRPPQVRRLLESALAVTEPGDEPPVSSSFPSYHAFIRARVRTLPPAVGRGAQRGAAGQPASPGPPGETWPLGTPVPPGSALETGSTGQPGTGAARRQVWRKDRRAMLIAEFLASDEAEDLSDREAASRCHAHIVEYGCDHDFGRPLRMSPAKAETFLLDWLPRKVVLTPAEQHAMPHVLVAWVRWAGSRSGLDIAAMSKTLDAVFDSMGTFSRVYHDPASFGLEAALVARLLPDHDLEALPRRAFAFPVLEGNYRGTDLGALNPAKPGDRRLLLAADHGELADDEAPDKHIDGHVALADRLWRGDPPELWDAAQRLLDLSDDRHA